MPENMQSAKEQLADHLLSQQVEALGAVNVAKYLLLSDFDENDMVLEFGFDAQTIQDAKALIKEMK